MKGGRARVLALAVLAALGAAGMGAAGAEAVKDKIHEQERTKRDVDKQIREERKEIRELKRKDQSILSEIIRYNRKVRAARNDERVSRRNLNKVRSRLDEIEEEVENSWEIVKDRQRRLGRRLVAMYRQGPLEPLGLLLESESASQFLTRFRMLRHLANRDRDDIEETRRQLKQIAAYREEYEERESELEKQADEVRRAKEAVLRAKREREKKLYAVRNEKKKKEQLLAELREQSRRMQSMLNQLRADFQRRKSGMPAKHPDRAGGRLGSVSWPMRGRLVSRFGAHQHPKFKTTVFNRGIEIGGSLGKEVTACQDGTVLFADYFEGYGQMVVLDHGSGYMSVYGYTSALEVAVGQIVARGQKLGEVGAAGVSDVPALYFEVRYQGKPMDPLRYLRR